MKSEEKTLQIPEQAKDTNPTTKPTASELANLTGKQTIAPPGSELSEDELNGVAGGRRLINAL